MDNERFEGEIWDPACGDGMMARVLASRGNPVIATDLYDRGFGTAGIDFLRSDTQADNIITNPPYNAAEGFVKAGLKKRSKKICTPSSRYFPRRRQSIPDNFFHSPAGSAVDI